MEKLKKEDSESTMLKIAHRGASGYAPENTLEAFQKAIDLKADMIELDIHQWKGQLVVRHQKPKKVGANNHSPLLAEVIHFIKGKIQLNIEIKEGGKTYPGIEENLLSLLKQEGFEDQCVISSFDASTMRQIKSLTSSGTGRCAPTYGLIFDRRPMVHLQKAVEMGLDVVHPRWTVCTPELVDQAHQRKKKVFTWTVNTPDQVQYFKKMGVDGIISDYPDIL